MVREELVYAGVTELLSFEKATGQQDKGFLWSLDWAKLSYLKYLVASRVEPKVLPGVTSDSFFVVFCDEISGSNSNSCTVKGHVRVQL